MGSVAESIDPEKELVLVTSDHGNLENMNVKIHTNNPVPALAVGKDHRKLFKLLKSRQDISGVLPSILEVLRE